MPLSQAVMLDIFPPRQVPRVMALWSAALVLGPVIGPTIGGWLTENFSWRWVFYINVPLGHRSPSWACYLFMSQDRGGRQRPFDFLGFGALAIGIGGVPADARPRAHPGLVPFHEIWTEAIVAMIGIWLFVVQTADGEASVLSRATWPSDRNFVSTAIFGFFISAYCCSTNALLPSFMQSLLGYSALQSG